MKRAARLLTPLFSILLMSVTRLLAQGPALTPGDSLVMGSIPPVPAYPRRYCGALRLLPECHALGLESF